MSCLADPEVLAFVRGDLPQDALERADAHLDACPSCRRLVTEAARGLPHDAATPPPSGGFLSLTRGATVGRYVVLDVIGHGGMGVVYAAWDADLNRKVALKILRTSGDDGLRPEARDRLLREAQAMARLSHPNVVTVYEAGVLGDLVFLAMEFVEGATLSIWLRTAQRSWRQVLEVFRDAGRGLAAAHAAGLVHRDFKPDNVLVGQDGRARVTDFGLARLAGEHPGATLTGAELAAHEVPFVLSNTLTASGALAGTPAYMAPEQHRGATVDARSDQFSFCVALYEGLHGGRPFAGDSFGELASRIIAGRVARPRSRGGPSRLDRVLRRGLSRLPEDRFPAMESLLEALTPPRLLGRWWALAVGAVVVLTVPVSLWMLRDNPRAVCGRAHERLQGVWDQARRQAVKAAFLGSHRPHAKDTFHLVEQALDEHARAWVAMRVDSCEATHVRHEQSAALLDLRTACLDRRLSETRALIDLMAGPPNNEVVDRALDATAALRDLQPCADAAALTAALPSPKSPQARQEVEALRARLDDVTALEHGGQFKTALPRARAMLADARRIGHVPFLAEVLLVAGRLSGETGDLDRAEADLQESLQAAATARDHHHVAEAAVHLVRLVGYNKSRHDEALALSRFAEAQVAQAGNDPRRRAKILSHRGILYSLKGDYAAAHREHERALALREATFGPEHFELSESLHNLGGVAWQQGRLEDALVYLRRAAALADKTLGSDHPEVAKSVLGIGMALRALGKYEEAQRQHERALDTFARTFGRNHRLTAAAMDAMGIVLDQKGEDTRALRLYQEVLAIREKLFGPGHEQASDSLNNLGEFWMARSSQVEAQRYFDRALAIRQKALGQGHPKTASLMVNLGVCLAAQGRHSVARRYLEQALSSPGLAAKGATAAARAQFALARTLAALHAEPARSLALALRARDAFAAAGEGSRKELDQVTSWIAARGPNRGSGADRRPTAGSGALPRPRPR